MAQYLDDYQRVRIVDKIMKDVPESDKAAIEKEVQLKVLDEMTPEIADFYRKYPQMCNTQGTTDTGFFCALFFGDFKRDNNPRWQEMVTPIRTAWEARAKMERKLKLMFKTCRTVKSLHEKYPEFAKYYPEDSTPKVAKVKSSMTAEQLEALAQAKRLQEEAEAKRRLEAFSVAANLSSLGWTPSEDNN